MNKPKPIQQIDIIKIYETKRCLIVDDLTEVRASYKRMLLSFGAKVIDTAANGDQAMDLVKSHQYDIIISDYNLDESKDGQQVLEELRFMNLLKYTTLYIIITGESSREMVLGAIENQPDDYITKPISQKMMRTRLDRSLIKHEQFYTIRQAIDNRDYIKALQLCDEGIAANMRFHWDYVRFKGQIFILMKSFDKAKALYEEALKEKEFIWAKLGLARTLLELDQTEGVEDILKSILAIDPRYIEALDLLTEYYLKEKQYEKAQESIERATLLSPKSIKRHRQLAEIAEINHDDETCLRVESQLQSNQGKKTLAKNLFATAEKKLNAAKHKDPETQLDHAQSNLLYGDKNKAYNDLSQIAKENKDKPKIMARIDRISDVPITAESKKNAAELSQKGIQAYQRKEFDKAIEIFKEALKIFPNHIGVNLNMIQVVLAKRLRRLIILANKKSPVWLRAFYRATV